VADRRDVIILGAGHNGLVTAFDLARAGIKPLVLERRPVVGGCAVTEEFHSGFRCSLLAHAAGPLDSGIARDMQLDRHGLQWVHPEPRLFAPSPEGRALLLYSDLAKSAQEIAAFSPKDAAKFPELHALLARIANVLCPVLAMTPPDIDHPSAGDLFKLLQAGRSFRSLGRKDMYRLLRWGPMAVADFAAEWFETELLRAAIAARGIFGTAMGPWSAGSTMTFLLRAAADPDPVGTSSFPRGGMGALAEAMAAAARAAGAEIRTGTEVTQILVKDGKVAGVVFSTGQEMPARAVISSADPKRTLLGLVGPLHLDPSLVVKQRNYRCAGNVAKVNLALDALPTFTALAGKGTSAAALAGRIHIGPETDYLERAFDASKYGEFSAHPHLEVMIPSLSDPSLAPPGKHVMSIYVQYAPYKLRNADWNAQRNALTEKVIATLAAYAPDLVQKILAFQVITPLDFEQTFGLTGGHIFHGELALDQLFTMRPLLGWARYQTPIAGLYLCGSGTHPGTGLNGLSGRNAARAALKSLR